MIVTIDGPAGSGKSTAAKGLARRLQFEFLDTGAMYRAVALAALRAGVRLDDATGLEGLLECIRLEMPSSGVVLDGEDVSGLIRTPEVSEGASVVAVSAVVRPRLAALQRRVAEGRNMVCEGRDQGTVVFPDAGCKFFLMADAEERVRRRRDQLRASGQIVDEDELRRQNQQRDERDASRELAPMRPAEDAILLDSTGMTVEQVVDFMEQKVRERLGS
jgi:cytidylate kinase